MLNAAVKANSPTTGTGTTTPAWSPTVTYTAGQQVLFTDGHTYSSNASGNIGNTPSASSTFWTVVSPTGTTPTPSTLAWSSTKTYNAGDKVTFTDGHAYTSVTSNNLGNMPSATSTFWTKIVATQPWSTSLTYNLGDTALVGNLSYISLSANNIGNQPASSPTFWSAI
jgi:hypothetical protein